MKGMKQTEPEREPSSQEAERFDGDEIPENLAELIAAARKRLADSEMGE